MLFVRILTPEKTVFEGNALSLIAPGTIGFFEILTNHASMISSLQIGKLVVVLPNEQRMVYAISGGLFEIHKNNAILLIETIEEASEIDLNRAQEAYEKAFKLLDTPSASLDRHQATQALLRAKNRIEISKGTVSSTSEHAKTF